MKGKHRNNEMYEEKESMEGRTQKEEGITRMRKKKKEQDGGTPILVDTARGDGSCVCEGNGGDGKKNRRERLGRIKERDGVEGDMRELTDGRKEKKPR